MMKESLEKKAKQVLPTDEEALYEIVRTIHKNALPTVLPSQVPVSNREICPDWFITQLRSDISVLSESDKHEDNVYALWNVSKCQRMIMEQRRRLLFKDDFGKDIYDENINCFEDIKSMFIPLLDGEASCNKFIQEPDTKINTYIDILTNNELYIVKPSNKDNVDISTITQALLQASICEKNGCHIARCHVFNPIRGNVYTVSTDAWNRHEDLLYYCVQKREKIIQSSSQH